MTISRLRSTSRAERADDGSRVVVVMPSESHANRSVVSMLAEGVSPEVSAAINANCHHPTKL